MSGKPLEVLKMLYLATHKTLTRNDLVREFWNELAIENSTVGNAVSKARKALRCAMVRAATSRPPEAHRDYPIVTVNRGGGDGNNDRTAWRLHDLP